MLLEQRPALRPVLNTLLTVLCTFLRLNYSTHSDGETGSECMCVSLHVWVLPYVHASLHLSREQEREENISFLCMYTSTTFLYLCMRKREHRGERLLGVIEWACDVWVAAQYFGVAKCACTSVKSVEVKYVFSVFQLVFAPLHIINNAQSILFLLPISPDC